ncbi:MAG: response regulator [Elusimicrobiota bacterium]
MKILIGDDQTATRQLYVAMLEQYQCQITEATTGREVLLSIQAERPDLIVLDHNMPEMTGYEVIQELQKSPEFKKIPIIFITGKNFDQEFRDLIKLEVAEFVPKPFNVETLLEAIEKVTGRPLPPNP